MYLLLFQFRMFSFNANGPNSKILSSNDWKMSEQSTSQWTKVPLRHSMFSIRIWFVKKTFFLFPEKISKPTKNKEFHFRMRIFLHFYTSYYFWKPHFSQKWRAFTILKWMLAHVVHARIGFSRLFFNLFRSYYSFPNENLFSYPLKCFLYNTHNFFVFFSS